MGKKKGNGERVSTYKQDVDEDNQLDLSLKGLETVSVLDMALLPLVTAVDLSMNKMELLPSNFASLEHIVVLDLSKNMLTALPENFGDLENLKRLDLMGNQLRRLPYSFSKLTKLQWLDLSSNPWDQDSVILDLATASTSDTSDRDRKVLAQKVLQHVTKKAKEHEKNQAYKERLRQRQEEEELQRQKEEREKLRRDKIEEKKRRKAEQKQTTTAEPGKDQRRSAAADGGDDVTSDGLPPGFSIVSLLFVLVGVICVLMAVHHVGIVDLSMIANPLLDLLNMVQGTPLPF